MCVCVGFEFLCFPVKCAEAGWLLEFFLLGILTYSSYFGHGYCYLGCPKRIIWQACCLHFGTLGAILAAWGQAGGPSEQQEGHVGGQSQVVSDVGIVLDSFFFRLVSWLFFCTDLYEILTARGPKSMFL